MILRKPLVFHYPQLRTRCGAGAGKGPSPSPHIPGLDTSYAIAIAASLAEHANAFANHTMAKARC